MNQSNYAVVVQQSNPHLDSGDARLAERIVQAAPGRDLDAEAGLYRALAPRIRLYGLKHLRDSQAAQDLVQDVMLTTLHRLRAGEIREPSRIASFVLGTCRQSVIDIRRNLQRRQRLLDTYTDDVPMADMPAVPSLDLDRLTRCLQHLSERERTVILMTFFDDSSADKVALALNISAGNVRVIRHRSVEHLRSCVESKEVRHA